MSLRRHILTLQLRLLEKPYLARVTDPETLRLGFEAKARMWFRPPRGSRFREGRLGAVPVTWACGPGTAAQAPVILYFHGGGYVFGSPRTHRAMLARLSARTGLPACLPAYRLAPEAPFPAAVEDALAVWTELSSLPGGAILGGDSAGGGLALALLGEIARRGLPPPRGTFAFSPLTDLTFSGASFAANAAADPMLPAARADELAGMYLDGADPRDPRASPLFADFGAGGAPVWMSAGDTEILLDDTRRMAARLRAAGVAVTEEIAPGLPHVWPIFPPLLLPEAGRTMAALAGWINSLPPAGDS